MEYYPIPTEEQEEWSNCELGVIIHHCLEIYNPEIPLAKVKCSPDKLPASIFTPKKVDTDQWLEAASEMGAKYAVFVANHVTGFSMWPTKANKYSIEGSLYMDGKADIVKDFIASCKKYNIRPGIYYSTGCNGYYGINDSEKVDTHSQVYRDYIEVVESQLAELWGNYGKLFEIWFDGGVIPVEHGGPDVEKLIKQYQPQAVCFQGPQGHRGNMRWIGNERGFAPIDCWSTSRYNTYAFGGEAENKNVGIGSPDGKYWIPAETDLPNRSQDSFAGGWAWRVGEEDKVFTPEHLLECYYTSVGRNSNLLLGMAINQDGFFEDTEQFRKLGQLIREIYSNPVASIRGIGTDYQINLGQPTLIKHIIIMEDIHYGEKVRGFTVSIRTDGDEQEIFNAKCIGHKRIIKLDKTITEATLRINHYVDTVIIKAFTLYA